MKITSQPPLTHNQSHASHRSARNAPLPQDPTSMPFAVTHPRALQANHPPSSLAILARLSLLLLLSSLPSTDVARHCRAKTQGPDLLKNPPFDLLVQAQPVPNPLFDLAGIMCGQLGIPFWKFFSATLIGKAIIKTHIQTAFIILICNNQLLDFVENELIWVLSHVPGLASILPNLIAKLHIVKQKYMTASPPAASNIKDKKWDLSLASVWNTVVWLMLMNFAMKIVTETAQSFLKERQEKELASLTESAPTSTSTICNTSQALD
ncbi:hypothetical protein TEA_030127 [Camellia sinensis var. sinensis]|uniref:Vacuole membrane protein KMS1 n=1 Tax=Camellia sinensis var. sinensis TaxID=542762 RepID=A0A4S4EM42_CAMSN|nr:hypothetical protein TEA_030127 [Camellia sinensis var. sinensis]